MWMAVFLSGPCVLAMRGLCLPRPLPAAPAHQIKHQDNGGGDPQDCGDNVLTHFSIMLLHSNSSFEFNRAALSYYV
jgi:hypothetical protein